MPCYPALALLLGSAMAAGGVWVRRGTRVLRVLAGAARRGGPGAGLDGAQYCPRRAISRWRSPSIPSAYTLSLGHMEDLTLASLAYLRLPLVLAGVAFLMGALLPSVLGRIRRIGRDTAAFVAAALMMVVFFHAARLAMVAFDPYLSSRPLAEAFLRSPKGTLVVDGHDYPFSSVIFYANRSGAAVERAPPEPGVRFLRPRRAERVPRRCRLEGTSGWKSERCYLVTKETQWPRLERLVGPAALHVVASSGGKLLLSNQQ